MTDRQLAGLSMLGINKPYELLTNCTYLCDRMIEAGSYRNYKQFLTLFAIFRHMTLNYNMVQLIKKQLQIYGLKIYGSPWHPMPGYSFFRSRGQALLHKWNQIPNKLDVLITHTPPLGKYIHY